MDFLIIFLAPILSVLFFCSESQVLTYRNIDFEFPLIISNKTIDFNPVDGNAQFGLSISPWTPRGSLSSNILIGVPQGSNPLYSETRTGTVLNCSFTGSNNNLGVDCRHVNLRPKAGDPLPRNGSRLGTSIAVHPDNIQIAIGAPNYPLDLERGVQSAPKSGLIYYYDGTGTKAVYQDNTPSNLAHYYGRLFGYKLLYAEYPNRTSDSLIISAPALSSGQYSTHRGSIISHRNQDDLYGLIYNEDKFVTTTSLSGYLGISLERIELRDCKSGPSKIYIAAGAVKGGDKRQGSVSIFADSELFGGRYSIKIHELKAPDDFGAGNEFGASLLFLSYEQEVGLREEWLLVGAPYFGDDDHGAVLYFRLSCLSQNDNREADKTRLEVKSPGAHFGMSMARIGDVNGDNIPDFAVGAPHEAGGRGAVHVFVPSEGASPFILYQSIPESNNPKYFQFRGFGFSLSSSEIDVDGNGYEDLIVGAPHSGHVVVHRTRPVGTAEATIDLLINNRRITDIYPDNCTRSWDDTCFKIKICIRYHPLKLEYETDKIKFLLTTKVDPRIRVTSNLTSIVAYNGNEACKFSKYYDATLNEFKEDDYNNRLTVSVTYAVVVPRNHFCPECPVLIPRQGSISNTSLTTTTFGIEKGCSSGICRSHFDVTIGFVPFKSSPTDAILLGSSDHRILEMIVNVTNSGDPAYAMKIQIEYPFESGIELYGQDPYCKPVVRSDVSRRFRAVECIKGNVLFQNKMISYGMQWNISTLTTSLNMMEWRVKPFTSSDQTQANKEFGAIMDILKRRYINIRQKKDANDWTYSPGGSVKTVNTESGDTNVANTSTILLVSKHFVTDTSGESPVEQIRVSFDYPVSSKRDIYTKLLILEASIKEGAEDLKNCTKHSIITNDGALPQDSSFLLASCSNYECERISCLLPMKHSNASVSLFLKVDLNTLEEQLKKENITNSRIELRTKAFVSIEGCLPDESGLHVLNSTSVCETEEVATIVISRQSALTRTAGPADPILIIGSAVAALVILLITTLILIRVGFFRRSQREELQRLMAQQQYERDWAGIEGVEIRGNRHEEDQF